MDGAPSLSYAEKKTSERMKGANNPFYGRRHSEETRRHLSEIRKGRRLSPSWKQKIGASLAHYYQDPEARRKHGEKVKELWKDPAYREKTVKGRIGRPSPMLGKHHTEETKKKLSVALKGKPKPEEFREKLRGRVGYWKGKKLPLELRQKLSVVRRGRTFTETHKQKISQAMKAWRRAHPEHTEKCREVTSRALRELWGDPEWRQAIVPKLVIATHKHPNKTELALLNVLDEVAPDEYRYVGNGQVVMGGMCPDFINCNGQKKIIELFGDYWHRGEDPQIRMDAFKQFGFDTLVVWERELKHPEALADKIRQFALAEVR